MDDLLVDIEEMVLGPRAPSKVAKDALAKAEDALQDIEEKNPLVAVFIDKKIRVIGTVKHPLFCGVDVGDHLGDHNYNIKLKAYVSSETTETGSYIVTKLVTDKMGRSRETLYLTENGLYRYLMRSNTTKAAEFQAYVYGVLQKERERVVDAVQLALKISNGRCLEATSQCRLARSDADRAMQVANDLREENRQLRAQISKRAATARAKEDARILALENANANRGCFETAHRF